MRSCAGRRSSAAAETDMNSEVSTSAVRSPTRSDFGAQRRKARRTERLRSSLLTTLMVMERTQKFSRSGCRRVATD